MSWNFKTYVMAQTRDDSTDASDVFTGLSEADWVFNATGTFKAPQVNLPGVSSWTGQPGVAGVSTPATWKDTAGTAMPYIGMTLANNALTNEKWA